MKTNESAVAVIEGVLHESNRIRSEILNDKEMLNKIAEAAALIKESVAGGGTIYACGNGGSSNDAMHLTEELVARYKRERPGIRAMHFMDAAVLTCWANDYEFNTAFERQVRTFCKKEDVLIAISTSGNSANVIKAVEATKETGTKSIFLGGKDGGKLKDISDVSLVIPSNETERIQELHITLIHIFCELLER